MYRKEKRTIFFWAKRKYREIRDFLFSLFGQEAGRVLIETLSRPGNESCSMAPTPRPGLETNDIAFPTPGNQMEILCVLSKTDELSNNETPLLWTILSSSGPMQLERQIWSDWWAIKKSTVALKRRRRQLQRLLFRSSEGNNDQISNCTLHKNDQIDELN